ncbi:MAG: UDP-N-acetylmuramoyl-tripeptide--D-alanyl-D-alanine ligase [Firmicutes bacterium]|nr:UDP-N-acetylmuramoyl-tripeptide--D-alanyl-D-alanine ligase [Bacillota bacterium]
MKSIRISEILRWLEKEDEIKTAPDGEIRDVVIDSRKVTKDSLFVALPGERVDGHDYIPQAFAAGARMVFSQDPEKTKDIRVPEGAMLVQVENCTRALGVIARKYRDLYHGRVAAITGSVGKTSTKDLTAAVLSGKFRTMKTIGNYNNELGLPLTLFRMDGDQYDAAVIEMGMGYKGDIDYLSWLTQPEVGIVTNVGTSHIENLGSREAILHAKLELVPHLAGEKKLFLNGDDPLLYSMKDKLPVRPEYFGRDDHNDCRLLEVSRTEKGKLYVRASYQAADYQVEIDTLGLHMAMNVLPAIMTGVFYGMSPDEIRKGLTHYEATPHRLESIQTEKYLIIDDTYNASPSSMNSAVDTLMDIPVKGRRIAILGDILEMGSFAVEGHREVGLHTGKSGVDRLLACGKESRAIYEAAIKAGMDPSHCFYYEDLEKLCEAVGSVVKKGDTILLKASHSMEFSRLIDVLTK